MTKYGFSLRLTDDAVTHLNSYVGATGSTFLRVVSINENPLSLELVREGGEYPVKEVTSAEVAQALLPLVKELEPRYKRLVEYAAKESLMLRHDYTFDDNMTVLSLIRFDPVKRSEVIVAFAGGQSREEAARRLLRELGTKCQECHRFFKTSLCLSPGVADALQLRGKIVCPTCIGYRLTELDEFRELKLGE